MKRKPYYTDIALSAVCGFVGLFIGDVISYFMGILSPLGIVLGVVIMLVWIGLYGYIRKRAWLRKQAAQEGA